MPWSPTGSGGVRIDPDLTDLSIGWQNLPSVGNELFTPFEVKKQTGQYVVFGQENMTKEPNGDISAPGAQANEILGRKLSKLPYYVQKHQLQQSIPWEEIVQSGSELFDPMFDATELVTDKIMLIREDSIVKLATTAANYATGLTVTLSGTSQFTDLTNSDPIAVFKTARRAMHAKILREPNVAVIPYAVMSYIEDNSKIIDRIKYSALGVSTPEILAKLLGLEKVFVPGTGVLATASSSMSYLWGNDVILAYVDPSRSRNKMTFGHEFTCNLVGFGASYADTWTEQRTQSEVVRVTRSYDLRFPTQDASGKNIAGYLIKAAI